MQVHKITDVEKGIAALGQPCVLDAADRNTDEAHAQAPALLAQLDRIPDRADAFDPLPWDEQGLPI
jgi:antitoxin VapB